ncbi:hypothetical protein AB1Y20_018808 [Prymnesium parvum]|uniref:Uncharacterized protein n=1 Tax=Prymnesium parvum TaxID=97485 RepID=A0AB34JPA5_PRYPA
MISGRAHHGINVTEFSEGSRWVQKTMPPQAPSTSKRKEPAAGEEVQPTPTEKVTNSKRGRKSGGLGNWTVMEDTACVLASVDACEQHIQSTDAVREAAAAAAFPKWMAYCRDTLKMTYPDKVIGVGATRRIINMDIAAEERAKCGGLVKRYKGEFLKFTQNILMPFFHEFLTKDGELPSGRTRDDHEQFIKKKIWEHEQKEKVRSKAKRAKPKGERVRVKPMMKTRAKKKMTEKSPHACLQQQPSVCRRQKLRLRPCQRLMLIPPLL